MSWLGCGLANLATTRDSRTSLVYATPLVAADVIDDESDGGTTLSPANPVTIVCAVLTQQKFEGNAVKSTVYSSPGVGVAVLQPTTVTYPASNLDSSFICSGFWLKLPDGTWIHKWDDLDNNIENGITCASTSVGAF